MRLTALVPAVLCLVSLILSFLCLFAGHKQAFMTDYPIVTLNSSRLGYSLFNTTSEESDNPFRNFYNDIENSIQERLNEGVNDLARQLGMHDFYSAYVQNHCEGFYTPGPIANETVKKGEISRNVTDCSKSVALYHFDPKQELQDELDQNGLEDISLEDLNWPDEVDDGIQALRMASQAMFVLYCIAIGFIFLALVAALAGVFFNGRMSALANVIIDWFAFLAIGIASALITAIGVKAADVINEYGNEIGISASRGSGFLGLTWGATAVMFLVCLAWCFECITGRRRAAHSKNYYHEK